MIYTEKIEIPALPPFSFDLSCEIFADGDKQIRNYENGRFWQVIRVNGKLVLTTIESNGSVDNPKLAVELKSNATITGEDKKKAEDTVTALFNLDLDLKPFYETVKNDKKMANLTRKLWGLKNPTTSTIFEAMLDSIVEQQISLKVANSLERRIIKRFGDALNMEGKVYYAYPTPQRLVSVSNEEFRQCGLSFRKGEYIREAARLITEGKLNLEKLKGYESSEQIIKELDEVRVVSDPEDGFFQRRPPTFSVPDEFVMTRIKNEYVSIVLEHLPDDENNIIARVGVDRGVYQLETPGTVESVEND